MLSTLLVTLVQIAFAAEMTNPLIKALASGCGSRVYTETIEASAIDEMTTCYQMGLNELPRKRLPTMELAFQTCGSFKLELRQFACLDGFKNEAREPKLHKIFNDCANSMAYPPLGPGHGPRHSRRYPARC